LTGDFAGDHHCLDLAPAPGGDVGQVILWWHDDDKRTIQAKSFREWLDRFAYELEAGFWHYSHEYGGLRETDVG
jgi:cell wall assembly regulator SMI1